MQIPAVTNHDHNTNFGHIYIPQNIKFNEAQEKISKMIQNTMRKPIEQFNGKTAEGFYKETKGIDFNISPHNNDSVYLTAYKGLREIGVGKERGVTYSEHINIGEYDSQSTFNINDIEVGIKDKKHTDRAATFAFALLPAFAVTTIFLSAINKAPNKVQEAVKPLTEKADTFAAKVKPIIEDTVKVIKPIKK